MMQAIQKRSQSLSFVLICIPLLQAIPVERITQNETESVAVVPPAPSPETNSSTSPAAVDDIVTNDFTQKVLESFFEELKNRPDLVDSILRREAVKLLFALAEDAAQFQPLPEEVMMQQDKLFAPLTKPSETSKTTGILPSPEMPQPPSQQLQSQNIVPSLDKKDTVVTPSRQPTNQASNNAATTNGIENNMPGDNLLLEPYYYYLYYDENEKPVNTELNGLGGISNNKEATHKINNEASLSKTDVVKSEDGERIMYKNSRPNGNSKQERKASFDVMNSVPSDLLTKAETEDSNRVVSVAQPSAPPRDSQSPLNGANGWQLGTGLPNSHSGTNPNSKITDEETELSNLAMR